MAATDAKDVETKPLDHCSFCLGRKGGAKGNENRYQTPTAHVVACDYCSVLIGKVIDAVRERDAEIAESIEHPRAEDWDWNRTIPEGRVRQRAQFYKNHIVHAWKQAGFSIARMIRSEGKIP